MVSPRPSGLPSKLILSILGRFFGHNTFFFNYYFWESVKEKKTRNTHLIRFSPLPSPYLAVTNISNQSQYSIIPLLTFGVPRLWAFHVFLSLGTKDNKVGCPCLWFNLPVLLFTGPPHPLHACLLPSLHLLLTTTRIHV